MYAPQQDRSWMFSLLVLCILIWIWVIVGCSPAEAGNPPAPEFDTAHRPKPYSCPGSDYSVTAGWIREDHSVFAYAVSMGGESVRYMVYEVLNGEAIGQAWVDPDFDGDYDLYYATGDDLADAYPTPCSVLPQGPGSKL